MEDGTEECQNGGGVIGKAQCSLSLSDHQSLLQNIVEHRFPGPSPHLLSRLSGGSPGIRALRKAH